MGFSVLLMTTWTCQGLPTCWKMQGTTHAMVAMSQCSQEPVNSSLHISICCRYATQTTDVSHRTLHTLCELYVQAVMYALNSGGNYQPAGPLHLAGGTSSWRTPLAKDIRTFDEFQASCTEAHSPPMLSCYCTCTYVRILPQCMLSSCWYEACSLKPFKLMVSLLHMIPVLPGTMKSLT